MAQSVTRFETDTYEQCSCVEETWLISVLAQKGVLHSVLCKTIASKL